MCASFTTKTPAVCACTDVAPGALPACVNPGPAPPSASPPPPVPGWVGGLVAFILFSVGGGLAAVRYMNVRQHAEVAETLDEFQRGLLSSAGGASGLRTEALLPRGGGGEAGGYREAGGVTAAAMAQGKGSDGPPERLTTTQVRREGVSGATPRAAGERVPERPAQSEGATGAPRDVPAAPPRAPAA